MANFVGGDGGGRMGMGPYISYPTRIPARHARVRRQLIPDPDDTITALKVPAGRAGFNQQVVDEGSGADAPINVLAGLGEKLGFNFDWFEKFHVRPPSFIFGNVLSTQQVPVSVYSAYRKATHSWDAFVNNAGAGTELLNQPAYPYSFPPQTGFAGLLLEVSPSGPPVVDTTLDFVFDTMTISPIIQLNRLVLFDLPPELPYSELLEFLTEIQDHRNGSEQRLGLRKNPRQFFEWDLVLEDSFTRSRIHNLLFDWHARAFGIPIWHESRFLSAAATAGALSVTLPTTSYADYRVGGLVLIYESHTKFDVLEIETAGITGTTLTFTNGLQNSYTTKALVMPLRTGYIQPTVQGTRLLSDGGRLALRFRVTDNDNNLASTAGWTTYNSKVVLDDVNSTDGGLGVSEELIRDLIIIDGDVGPATVETLWPHDKRGHTKTFWVKTPADLWKVRQLVHALRGRQVSFYLPTKGHDLELTAQLLSAGTSLTVRNVGYARYVQNRQTRNIIQVIFNDGTASLIREITASSEVDANTETMTVDVAWPATKPVSTIDRIQYLELSRFASDSIRFRYALGERTCRISAPTITVFDA
jgi:hypothetical protein